MRPEILEYIRSQKVCVLAVEMMDGSPHGATVHYANAETPLVFIIETDRDYRKSEPLFGRETSRASMVIGTNEDDMKTLQLDGEVRLLGSEQTSLKEIYLEKFPDKKGKAEGSKVVFFTFTPTWWRFTDWTKPAGKTIFTSET